MKIRVLKMFGHEVLRLETHVEATVSDVVQAMLAHRLAAEDDEEEMLVCESCGEMIDEQAEVNERFADIAENLSWGERLVWDAAAEEDEDED